MKLLAGVALLLTLASPLVAQTQSGMDAQFLEFWKAQPRVALNVPAGGAKVVIVKFNDWMCPGCKYWYEQMKPVLAKHQATPGAIKYVEKDWPWNTECNTEAGRTIPGHESACAAAAAVRLAADRGKRDAMADWVYANQPSTDAQRATILDRLKAKTTELLGITNVAAAYATKLPEIRRDIADGKAAKISTTPTYFINGVRTAAPDGSMIAPRYVEIAIQYELQTK